MRDVESERHTWTARDVEESLVAAFRATPSIPVFSSGQLAGAGDVGTANASWAAMLADDAIARRSLWAWARCRATLVSFAELCRGMGWPRATAEAARRRGASAIAGALNERAKWLDNGNATAGTFARGTDH